MPKGSDEATFVAVAVASPTTAPD